MPQDVGLTGVLRPIEEIPLGLIVAILAVALLLSAGVQRGLPWLAERLPGRLRPRLLSLVPFLRLAILSVALLQVAPLVVRTDPPGNLLVVLGAGGVAIGFAFRDYASSLIAGVVAIYERPYRVGDRVAIGGQYGEVRSISLRALTLVTPDDTLVTLPHSRIWTDAIQNSNDGAREQLCVAEFFLHPEHDAGGACEALRAVAWSSPYLLPRRPVTVSVREQPWGTHYRLKAYPVDGRDEFAFVSDLTARGKAALARAGARPAHAPLAAAPASR